MTRSLDATTVAAVQAGHVPYIYFVKLSFDSQSLLLCSAGYNYRWHGVDWLGIGALGSIEPILEQASLEAIGIRMTLSGVPTEVIGMTLQEQYQGNPCEIWFAPLREDLQLLVQPVKLFSGRMDTMDTEIGDSATITLSAESRMVAWDRPKVRRYNNEDQQSRYPGDRGFEYVSQMVERNLSWGK